MHLMNNIFVAILFFQIEKNPKADNTNYTAEIEMMILTWKLPVKKQERAKRKSNNNFNSLPIKN